jgi:hypothetical protein
MRLPTRRPSRASGRVAISKHTTPLWSTIRLSFFWPDHPPIVRIPSSYHLVTFWTCSHPQVSLHISIIVELVLIPRYPFTSVLLLNLFSSPGILLHQYYCWTCSHSPVSLDISIIVVLVLIPRYPFTSVLLLYLFSSPGIPLHQYYSLTCWDENKFNNNTDVKGYRGMRTSSTIILM